MHTLRMQIHSLVMGQSFLRRHLRRSSGSSSLPEAAFPGDQEEIGPEEDENAMKPLPILRSRQTDLFYLPDCVGPDYQGLVQPEDQTMANLFYPEGKRLEKRLAGFGGNLWPTDICVGPCPKLLTPNLRRLFRHPSSHFCSSMNFSMLGLRYRGFDRALALRAFMFLAGYNVREMLRYGFWADFVNPQTGRAEFRGSLSAPRTSCPEAEALSKGLDLFNANGCTVIEEAKGDHFIGTIFTDMPVKVLELWCS
ncbi:uncharacterized protein [Drosophila bipectinata]|uniref:uncharacterized protein n=1 Tax=Drosophila bipectinata TaxID=42026 RepID=UPI001C897EA9|nr:uncharacterized protein LOC108132303 [Drosophila bipectinata]